MKLVSSDAQVREGNEGEFQGHRFRTLTGGCKEASQQMEKLAKNRPSLVTLSPGPRSSFLPHIMTPTSTSRCTHTHNEQPVRWSLSPLIRAHQEILGLQACICREEELTKRSRSSDTAFLVGAGSGE